MFWRMCRSIRFCRRTKLADRLLLLLHLLNVHLATLHGQFLVSIRNDLSCFVSRWVFHWFSNFFFFAFSWSTVFVAMSTFGAVNGILLTSSRLFYAGACEGQMPEILTMIQIQRFTPTPAVLVMALLSMLYLTVSDIFALINYVGFATWVSYLIGIFQYLFSS